MPWHIGTHADCPADEPVAVIKDDDGSLEGCHANQEDAKKQLAALYANEAAKGGTLLSEQRLQEQPSEGVAYAMVAWLPPPDLAAQLAVEGEGAEPADLLHVTLVYLGGQATLELDRTIVEAVVADVAGRHGRISGIFNGTCLFGAEGEERSADDSGKYPLVATLDAPGLGALREDLAASLREHVDYPEDTHGFVAHLTRAYLPAPPDQMPPPPMLEAELGELAVCWGDYRADPANLTLIPLGGIAARAEAMVVHAEPERRRDAAAEVLPCCGMARQDWPLDLAVSADPARVTCYNPALDFELTASLRSQFQARAPFQVVAPPALSEEPEWKALVVVEGKKTDDFRNIEPGALRPRQTPLPLMWTGQTSDNHDGSERAGTITRLWKDGNAWRAEGVYVDTAAGHELRRQTEEGIPYWPSVDIGGTVSIFEQALDGSETELLIGGVIVGFTDVSMPAQEGTWFLPAGAEEPALPAAEEPAVPSLAASAAPIRPPAAWLEVPAEVPGLVPFTVTDQGQVFGFIAGDGCHVGLPGCVRAPGTRPPAGVDYSMFNEARGVIRVAEGHDVRVGPVTLVGGHAPLRAGAGPIGYQAATAHYDDTRSTVAYGRVGPTRVDGRVLPWFSGVLRPDATEEQVHALRAHGVSGDWRPVDGRTTLAAVLSVPVPGLPVRPKALVASGRLEALITSSPPPPDEEEDMDLARFKELYQQMVANPGMSEAAAFEVVGQADLPIADREMNWDGAGAGQRVAETCGGVGALDPACYSRAFFWRDPDADETTVGAYKLGFADVVNGRVQAIPRGIFACAVVMPPSGRATPDVPAEDLDRIKARIAAYYDRMRVQFDDPEIVAPWEQAEKGEEAMDLSDVFEELHAKAHADDRPAEVGLDAAAEGTQALDVGGKEEAALDGLQEEDAAPPEPPPADEAEVPGGPPADLVTAFQQGNIGPLLDWYCANFPWGQEGAHTACMETAAGHVDNPGAFCNYVGQLCGAALEVPMTPELLVASMAADTVRARFHGFYAPEVKRLREHLAAGAEG
jgi:hypothetical protein